MGEGHPGPCMAALPAAAAWWACPDCLETAARAEAAGFSGAARRTSLSMRCSSGASAPACASSAPAAAAAEALASCSGWGVDARRGRRAVEAQQGCRPHGRPQGEGAGAASRRPGGTAAGRHPGRCAAPWARRRCLCKLCDTDRALGRRNVLCQPPPQVVAEKKLTLLESSHPLWPGMGLPLLL